MVSRPRPCILDDFESLGFVDGKQRWASDGRKRLYTWDSLHGEVEVFNGRGKHLGVKHAVTGMDQGSTSGEIYLMSNHRSFLSLALAGEVMTDEIDDSVDQWHEAPMGLSLHEYLGMTTEEYGLWLDSPDTLPLIIASKKLAKPLESIANDNLREMRLAARADDTTKVKRLQAWLQRRDPARNAT
jgi:hypothetical protein